MRISSSKDLSPGQKQKLAFARLFFHRPAFVVLDECTNGISPGKILPKSLHIDLISKYSCVFAGTHI